MSRFLDNFSATAKKFSDAQCELVASVFRTFLEAIRDWPEESFVSEGSKRFSIALFEAALYGLCRSMWEENRIGVIPATNAIKLKELENNAKFKDFLQEGTTKQVNVRGRLDLARKAFAV
jgi:hypothetical protein